MTRRFTKGRGRGRGRGRTIILGAFRGFVQESGFDPAVLPIKPTDPTQKYGAGDEAATAGDSTDATLVPVNVCTEAATATAAMNFSSAIGVAHEAAAVVSRPAGYLYSGSTTSDPYDVVSSINKLEFGTMTVSVIGASATVARAYHAGACSPDNGYFASGMDITGTDVTSIDKFVISSETASANSASTSYFHREGRGFETLNGVFFAGGTVSVNMGYVLKVNPSTDAVTDGYVSELFNTQHRNGPAAVSDGNNYGYICGGYDGTAYSNAITRMDTAAWSGTTISATLGAQMISLVGVSSKTKGYIAGYDTGSNLLTFSTETNAAGGTAYPAAGYIYIGTMVGGGKGFFVGGHDGTSAITAIKSVELSTDTWASESAVLGAAKAHGAGIDSQLTTTGGAADTQTTITIDVVKEPSGLARGFLGGSINDTYAYYGIVGMLDFATETPYQFPYPTVSTTYDKRRPSGLQSSTDGYFCGGRRSSSDATNITKFGLTTYATSDIAATVANGTYDAGVDGTTFGVMGSCPASYTLTALTYSTEATRNISAVSGVNYAGFGWNGKAYFGGGMATGTPIYRFTFSTEVYAALGATLPAARWFLTALNLGGSGYFAAGSNNNQSTAYDSVYGFLESTEASRTVSATLSLGRSGCAGLSGYTKGYIACGTPSSTGRYVSQRFEILDFSTEAMSLMSATLAAFNDGFGAFENGGISYRPALGLGAGDASEGTGPGGSSHSATATATDAMAALGVFPSAKTEPLTAADSPSALAAFAGAHTAAATATSTESATRVATVVVTEATTADASQLVFGTDVSIPESATADNTQSVWAAFAGVTTETATAIAAHPVTAVFASSGSATATATDTLAGSVPHSVSISNAANASETEAGGTVSTSAASESVTATDTEVGSPMLVGAGVESATPMTAQDYSVFVIGSAVAAATTVQDAHAVVVNVSVVEAGTAGHSNVAFAVLWDSVVGSTAATAQQSNVLRTTAAASESATPGHQQQAIASFSTVALDQASALDTAFATGVLTAAAAEALAAIVSAYAVIAGEVIDKQSVFIVSRENKEFVLSGENAQYVVSTVDSDFVLHTVGKAFVLSSDGDNVVVKDNAGRNSVIVKGGGNG